MTATRSAGVGLLVSLFLARKEIDMPLLEPVGDDTTSMPAKATFEKLHAKLKMVPNAFRTMAHAPEVLDATLTFNASFQSGLDPKL